MERGSVLKKKTKKTTTTTISLVGYLLENGQKTTCLFVYLFVCSLELHYIIIYTVFDCGSTDIIKPDNGTVTLTTTTLGSVAAFTCDTSFVLTGRDVTRTCQTTGWTGSNPSCSKSIVECRHWGSPA